MVQRRHRGEGSTFRKCADRWGCPPSVETVSLSGKTRRARPDHGRSCKAPWAYAIDEGLVGGRRQRKVITAMNKADLLAKVEAERERRSLGVVGNPQTVGDWLEYWLSRVAPENVRPRTLRGYRGYMEQYLVPALGSVKLQDLTPEHVERLHDWMRALDKARLPGAHGSGPLSDTTIRQAHMVLRSALAAAVQRRKIPFNPAAVVKAPKAVLNPHAQIGVEDAKAVLRVAQNERELCRLVVALVLGLRQGEALGLRWDDYVVDGPDRYLVVEEAVQRLDGHLIRTGVKSRASRRRIPIPDRMAPVFEAWRALATDQYVFPSPSGGPCDPKIDWKAWRESLARAGVGAIPLHGARGSAASLLADMGVPDWRIAEILGQAQVSVTRRHYVRGTEDSHREALGGLINELLPQSFRAGE